MVYHNAVRKQVESDEEQGIRGMCTPGGKSNRKLEKIA